MIQRCVNAFSDHELLSIVPGVDRLDSFVQTCDDLLPGGRRYGQNLVDFAVCHFDDTVGESLEADVVRHHDHCDLFAHVQVDQNLHDDVSAAGVQITRRLVEQQDLGLVGNGSSDGDSLLLTTGKLIGEVVHALLEAHILQKLPCSVADLLT